MNTWTNTSAVEKFANPGSCLVNLLNLIGFNKFLHHTYTKWAHCTALLCSLKAGIKFSKRKLSFWDSLSWYSSILFQHTYISVLFFPSPSSFTSVLSSYLLISTCLDVSFPPVFLSPTVPPIVLPSFFLQCEPNSPFIVLHSFYHTNRQLLNQPDQSMPSHLL